jgi:hypothetical protein
MPKLDSQTPARISSLDYNSIRDKIVSILGTGSGPRGYGQTIASSPVYAGNLITAQQWDDLKTDLINIRVHQDGLLPAIADIERNDVVRYGAGNPNTNYESLSEAALLNRFNIGTGQSVIGNKASRSTSASWSTQAQAVLTITFADANEGRYFFNSGGDIRISATRTGGSATQQNNAWTGLLSNVGVQRFSGNYPTLVNYYTLTNSYQTYYYLPFSTPYSSNFVRLEALCNVSNNSGGTATSVTIRITLQDDYVDPGAPAPGDSVDGTVTITVDELKASGLMLPSGTFTVNSPSYSLSAISTS